MGERISNPKKNGIRVVRGRRRDSVGKVGEGNRNGFLVCPSHTHTRTRLRRLVAAHQGHVTPQSSSFFLPQPRRSSGISRSRNVSFNGYEESNDSLQEVQGLVAERAFPGVVVVLVVFSLLVVSFSAVKLRWSRDRVGQCFPSSSQPKFLCSFEH